MWWKVLQFSLDALGMVLFMLLIAGIMLAPTGFFDCVLCLTHR